VSYPEYKRALLVWHMKGLDTKQHSVHRHAMIKRSTHMSCAASYYIALAIMFEWQTVAAVHLNRCAQQQAQGMYDSVCSVAKLYEWALQHGTINALIDIYCAHTGTHRIHMTMPLLCTLLLQSRA
jgi:hypothetical protein